MPSLPAPPAPLAQARQRGPGLLPPAADAGRAGSGPAEADEEGDGVGESHCLSTEYGPGSLAHSA